MCLSYDDILAGQVGHGLSKVKFFREYVDNANWNLGLQSSNPDNRKPGAFELTKPSPCQHNSSFALSTYSRIFSCPHRTWTANVHLLCHHEPMKRNSSNRPARPAPVAAGILPAVEPVLPARRRLLPRSHQPHFCPRAAASVIGCWPCWPSARTVGFSFRPCCP